MLFVPGNSRSESVVSFYGYKVMDHSAASGHEPCRSGSFSRASSLRSSLRHSLSLSYTEPLDIDDDIDSQTVSEAGDIGDRALQRRNSMSSSRRFSVDNASEHGEAISIQEPDNLQSYGLWSRDPKGLNTTTVVTPVPEEIISPLPTKPLVQSEKRNQEQDGEKILPQFLEYISCLIHLAVFGILGVMTRYLLQKLFGPSVARVTSDKSILYLDLPSNMVGSFLMGWWGVVYKADISKVSEFLAIGLTTGYLGSLTTFSGWNQKMLDLTATGEWVYAALGFLLGLFLAAYSIILGVETAKGFRWVLKRQNKSSSKEGKSCFMVKSLMSHMVAMLVMLIVLGALLAVSSALLKEEFRKGSSEAQLWLGCLVAPLGVWLRWLLARLNGRGLGKGRHLKWVPIGTLIANVSAACLMAALATLKKAVKKEACNTVATGLQLGLLGCLSTVSTLMAEFNAMRESRYPWRAYAYALFTIGVSFILGILIYSVPVWVLSF